jgi:two-component system sensor histidine kinase/response regulator
MGGAAAGAAFLIAWSRMRRLHRLNALLEEQVRRRTEKIAEQKEALEQANLKLLEMDKLKASMAAMLVHDLRSPLTSIGLTLDFLNEGITVDASTLEHCRHSTQNMLAMLNDLLDVFRSEEGGMVLDLAPVAIGGLLREVFAAYQPQCARRGLQLLLAPPESECLVLGDEAKVERVLANLVGNAMKYTPAGGIITLSARKVAGSGVETGLNWFLVEVQDTGRGIPAEDLPYVFDPYRQVQRKDSNLGVGLGLAIVQRIMAAHKGRVNVRSQVGVGTDFILLFPVMEAETAE